MREVIEGSVRAGEKVTRTAERLLDAGLPLVELPEHVRELAAAARFPVGPGDTNLYDQAVKRWSKTIGRLGQGAALEAGEFTVRSATQRLVTELRGATPAQVDAIVNRWVLDRARYQARVVARNEAVEAFRDASLDAMAQQPWVHGVRWTLSPRHPRPDICDVLANQDLYGLGPGGYPLESVPERHPNCLCGLVPIVDEQHFDRELAKAKGEPEPPRSWESGKKENGNEWLRQQDAATRIAIAGSTRSRLVMQGRSVMDGEGRFKPVYELLGKPKPIIERGPTIDASKLVKVDRAGMVRPFPGLKAADKTRTATVRAAARKAPPSARPKAPAPRPAPEPTPTFPKYGQPASAHAQLVRGFEVEFEKVARTVPLVGERYEGALPHSFMEHVRATERAVRETLQLTSTRPLAHAITLDAADPAGNGRGYMDWNGTLALHFERRLGAQAMQKTLIHEIIHTMGGATSRAYREAAKFLEEVATEELAQSFVGGRTKVLFEGARISMDDVEAALTAIEAEPTLLVQLEGSYGEARQRFFAIVASATGETDPERLTTFIRDSLRRWKSKAYASPGEAMNGMLDALQPSSANQREFYRRLLDDRAAWEN